MADIAILRAGNLYLVSRGRVGRLVRVPDDAGAGRTYPIGDVDLILSHCNASQSWGPVPPGEPLPPLVAAAVARGLPDEPPGPESGRHTEG